MDRMVQMQSSATQNVVHAEENIQVAKHMERCSSSLIIRVMQTKVTLRLHLIPVRMAIVKETDNKCL